MDELIFLVEDAPEGGYTARALGVSIFTEADELERLREQVGDAVRCHFNVPVEMRRIVNENKRLIIRAGD